MAFALFYRVSLDNGSAQFFYASPLPAHPNFDWQRDGVPHPYIYNGKEYLFIAESRLSGPDSIENFASLLEVETMQLLVEYIPLDAWLSKVEVVNGQAFCFTGTGYKIFSMETLSFEREVRLIDRVTTYTTHSTTTS